jgi:hypothetical protein
MMTARDSSDLPAAASAAASSRPPITSSPSATAPAASAHPSPHSMSHGPMTYYNRQLTADELLSAELERDAAGNIAESESRIFSYHIISYQYHIILILLSPLLTSSDPPDMLDFPPPQQVGVDPNHDLSYGDQSARRKRSKVSRACDECRRKKVNPVSKKRRREAKRRRREEKKNRRREEKKREEQRKGTREEPR